MPDLGGLAIATTFDALTLAAVAVAALVIVGALLVAWRAGREVTRPTRIDPESLRNGKADARLLESGISVWAIVGHWQLYGRNAASVAADYGIAQADVEAALRFYREHRKVIDARLTLNADYHS